MSLPDQPGSYILILHNPAPARINVGRLGCHTFPAGWYAYTGSARGPGGLAARLARHLRPEKAAHWHIDYVRPHMEPVAIWYTTGTQKLECDWANAFLDVPGTSIPVARAGASDCRCPAHLFYIDHAPALKDFVRTREETIQCLDLREPWETQKASPR